MEKSDYPGHVKTEADKGEFISKYEEKEGIKLDSKEIEKNPGQRQQAKLMLNSFWGKVSSVLHFEKKVYHYLLVGSATR